MEELGLGTNNQSGNDPQVPFQGQPNNTGKKNKTGCGSCLLIGCGGLTAVFLVFIIGGYILFTSSNIGRLVSVMSFDLYRLYNGSITEEQYGEKFLAVALTESNQNSIRTFFSGDVSFSYTVNGVKEKRSLTQKEKDNILAVYNGLVKSYQALPKEKKDKLEHNVGALFKYVLNNKDKVSADSPPKEFQEIMDLIGAENLTTTPTISTTTSTTSQPNTNTSNTTTPNSNNANTKDPFSFDITTSNSTNQNTNTQNANSNTKDPFSFDVPTNSNTQNNQTPPANKDKFDF